ncbi:MAG: GNAT family N-acetyltransferase [Deltaproteobacteria bacterium]|nr:GNAT family N-acetyltransferase [Deltaproteobacteria bacterium]
MIAASIPTADFSVAQLATPQVPQAAALLLAINDDTAYSDECAWLLHCLTRWPPLQVGAVDHGQLVGVASGAVDERDPGLGWSHDLVVSASYQHHGVGAALLRAQLQGFRLLGCSRIRGQSPTRLASAIAFFEHFGFRVVDETTAAGFPGIADGTRVFITECAL